jgi:hypothetical protein
MSQWGKKRIFSTNGVGKAGYPHRKQLSWNLSLLNFENQLKVNK